jgi:hypothetical protein
LIFPSSGVIYHPSEQSNAGEVSPWTQYNRIRRADVPRQPQRGSSPKN